MKMSPEDIEAMKRNIDGQMTEYYEAIQAYAEFMTEWRRKHGYAEPETGEVA